MGDPLRPDRARLDARAGSRAGSRRRNRLAPGPLRFLVASQPSNGSVDTIRYLFHAETAEHVGAPTDRREADPIEWVPLADIRSLIAKGGIVSGPTLIGLLLAMTSPAFPEAGELAR